jgi:hypothetical protein
MPNCGNVLFQRECSAGRLTGDFSPTSLIVIQTGGNILGLHVKTLARSEIEDIPIPASTFPFLLSCLIAFRPYRPCPYHRRITASVLDVVAIVSPAPGKEARVDEILKDLIAKVEKDEPDVAKYTLYKTQNAEGATEFVFVER